MSIKVLHSGELAKSSFDGLLENLITLNRIYIWKSVLTNSLKTQTTKQKKHDRAYPFNSFQVH